MLLFIFMNVFISYRGADPKTFRAQRRSDMYIGGTVSTPARH